MDELISQYDYAYNADNANAGKDRMKRIESIMRSVLKALLNDVAERSFVDVKRYLLKRFAEYGVDLNAEDVKAKSKAVDAEQSTSVQNDNTANTSDNAVANADSQTVLQKKTKRGRKPLMKAGVPKETASSPVKTRSNSKPQSLTSTPVKSPKQRATPVKSPSSSSKGKGRRSSSPSSSKQETPSPVRKLSIKPKPIIKHTQAFDSNESQISLRSRNDSSSKRSYRSSASGSKKKFYEELEEQYNVDPRRSPSKFNLTPMKKSKGAKSPSKDKKTPEKQRSGKKDNIGYGGYAHGCSSNKKDNAVLLGKKRGIQFNMERYIKEFDPKTPVKGIKMLKVRKSPIERKSNKKIKS